MKKFYSILLGIFLATNLFFGFGAVQDAQAVATRIFLTTTGAGNWTVPSDWNSANNTIEVIGGGSGGFNGGGGYSGGGGAYSSVSNQILTKGSSIPYSIGAGGNGGSGGNTWFGNASYGSAYVGATGAVYGYPWSGGQSSGGIGTVKYSGGNGYIGGNGGGGGGAAGMHGNGGNGVSGTGGTGDAGFGGAGGVSPGVGSPGTEWDSTHGSGGGGSGTLGGATGRNGGNYGGGGGNGSGTPYGGSGIQGIIVITYTPAAGPATIKTINGVTVSTGVKTKNGVTPVTTKSYQNNN